jgi:hypothetical protein
MCAVIADTELWWEPGTKTGYHAYPFGYIVGEIVRRATGYAYADTTTGIAFALTKNRLTSDFDAVEQVDEVVTKAVADS